MTAVQDSAKSYSEARLVAVAAALLLARPVVGVGPLQLAPEPRTSAVEPSAKPLCQKEEDFFEPAIENRAGRNERRTRKRRKQQRKKGADDEETH